MGKRSQRGNKDDKIRQEAVSAFFPCERSGQTVSGHKWKNINQHLM